MIARCYEIVGMHGKVIKLRNELNTIIQCRRATWIYCNTNLCPGTIYLKYETAVSYFILRSLRMEEGLG